MCVCVCVCVYICVCNPCESGRLTRFSPVNRGDTPNRGAPRFLVVVAPWSERCYNVQYSPWGYTMDSPFSRMESREMFV